MPLNIKKSIFSIALLLLLASSCKVGRFIIYNFADINDHEKFPSRPLHAKGEPFHFVSTGTNDSSFYFLSKNKKGEKIGFEKLLKESKTVAFLVIKNDTLKYEQYFEGYDAGRIVPSFSMAKSVTSMLIGCAIDEGLIKSVDEPIVHYIPELATNGLTTVTIKHLLQMTSGIKFNESYYNPFGQAASFYYGLNLRKQISKMKPETTPGSRFQYVSGDTQLLGLVLERALKGKTISQYLEQKIWQPLGMEFDASWSIDQKKNGLEKTFCCLNARARDFAKLGRLYLHQGNWNGQQLISEKWVKESTRADQTDGGAKFYKYQWWLPSSRGDFMAQGILGQFVYVNPAKNMVIVRLGKKGGNVNWSSVFMAIASKY